MADADANSEAEEVRSLHAAGTCMRSNPFNLARMGEMAEKTEHHTALL